MRSILFAVAILLVFLVIRETCMLKASQKNEGYADQVMHGVAGGIAGPILDASLYDYDAPRYPLPPNRRATALWATPPESPA